MGERKKTVSLTVKEMTGSLTKAYVEAIEKMNKKRDKESGWVKRLDEHIAEFLCCKSKDIVMLENSIPSFWVNSMTEAANFVVERNYKVHDVFNYNRYDEVNKSPNYRNIEVKPKNYKKLLSEGCWSCEDKEGNKFVVCLSRDDISRKFDDDTKIQIYSSKTNEDITEKVWELIKQRNDQNSILRKRKLNMDGKFIDLKLKKWGDIVLDSETVEEIKDNIMYPIEHVEEFRKLGLKMSRGILLEGIPGVGKTLLGTVLANEVDCTFIFVTPKDVNNGCHVSQLYTNARLLSPTVIFFEEVDLIAPDREAILLSPTLLSELLSQMDGSEMNNGVYTIATTNRPQMIEKALADRPGRIDRRILIKQPNREQQRQILRSHLGDNIKFGSDIMIEDILNKITGFTGAHISDLVHTSAVEALKDNSGSFNGNVIIRKKHLDRALVKIKRERGKCKELYA